MATKINKNRRSIYNDNYRQLRRQLFLSRHTARTICLIRIAHSSVRQFEDYILFGLKECAGRIGNP